MLKKLILEMGYYWNGMTNDVNEIIRKCGVCHAINYSESLIKKPKIILTYGPHKRYQSDLWYLPQELKNGHNYLYIIELIDHYSKWMYSFLLKNKTSELVLSKIKLFINMNGPCEIFNTDNGGEFNNKQIDIFFENLGILHLKSASYHLKFNGCCEAVHKEIKGYLLNKLVAEKDDFVIEIELANAIDYHNNRIIDSTNYKPCDLRDNNDEVIINEVVNNIIKSMLRKIKKFGYCGKNTLLLITPYIVMKNKRFIYIKNKHKKNLQYQHYLLNI